MKSSAKYVLPIANLLLYAFITVSVIFLTPMQGRDWALVAILYFVIILGMEVVLTVFQKTNYKIIAIQIIFILFSTILTAKFYYNRNISVEILSISLFLISPVVLGYALAAIPRMIVVGLRKQSDLPAPLPAPDDKAK